MPQPALSKAEKGWPVDHIAFDVDDIDATFKLLKRLLGYGILTLLSCILEKWLSVF